MSMRDLTLFVVRSHSHAYPSLRRMSAAVLADALELYCFTIFRVSSIKNCESRAASSLLEVRLKKSRTDGQLTLCLAQIRKHMQTG
jgi:hypothetical protein